MDAFTEKRIKMSNLEECIIKAHEDGLADHIAVRVGKGEQILNDCFYSVDYAIDSKTLFDMASVTKIMVTTMLTLIAADRKLLNFDDKVNRFFPCPKDKSELTIKHLLTHTMGYGHRSLCEKGNTYDNIQNYILSLPCDFPVGTKVDYSCPGFILLGKILEKVFGDRLDRLFISLIAAPLGMESSGYCLNRRDAVNSNLSEAERGLVNDYNCRFLGGVAGNAGLFSNIDDITKYMLMLQKHGEPLVSRGTFDQAIMNHTEKMSQSRGLGFLYVDSKYSQTGRLFPKGSIGHCGHTGQSVFIDLKSNVYVIILSDATVTVEKRYGYNYEKVKLLREKLHNAVDKDIRGT